MADWSTQHCSACFGAHVQGDWQSEFKTLDESVDQVCRSCLGLFQPKVLKKINDLRDEALNVEPYFGEGGCHSATEEGTSVALELPKCVMIRQRVFREKLRRLERSLNSKGNTSFFRNHAKSVLGIVQTGQQSQKKENPTWTIDITISSALDDRDLDAFLQCINWKKSFKPNINVVIEQMERRIKWHNVLDILDDALDAIPPQCVTYKVEGYWDFQMFKGNYHKYARNVSQSAWYLENMQCHSVEQYISDPIKERIGSKFASFQTAGREDLDVRMLGKGRPFILEIRQARSLLRDPILIKAIEKEIEEKSGGAVAVSNLQTASRTDQNVVKEAEQNKVKYYRAVIYTEKPVTHEQLEYLAAQAPLEISQKTPIRVLHRRAPLARPRNIGTLNCEFINPHCFILDLSTAAGTYIKEFVHSDFGRTQPSVRSILNTRCDILQLDVTEIDVQ
eukprot:Clim_evm92s147 gene=Clim_evmTU92s147